jgi:hypothetical protein
VSCRNRGEEAAPRGLSRSFRIRFGILVSSIGDVAGDLASRRESVQLMTMGVSSIWSGSTDFRFIGYLCFNLEM